MFIVIKFAIRLYERKFQRLCFMKKKSKENRETWITEIIFLSWDINFIKRFLLEILDVLNQFDIARL